VSSDNGATWTVVDSTIKTALEWDGYYAVNPDDANWHTMAFDLTPYISAGIFNVGIRYTDCGGNFAYGIGVDNLRIVKGDNSSWLTMEKMAGDIAAGDTMQMSLTMMPREDQNHIITSQLSIGQSASFDIDIAMITDPTALGVAAISLPNEFSLHQNYPNPFNPFTTIKYDLPERSDVSITVYDISGKEVTQLERRIHEAGQKSIRWDGTNQNGELVSAGMYIYRILAGNFHSVKKMILLK
jgi:Flagellar hook capping protein